MLNLILAPRRCIFAALHGCFGDAFSHLYMQESGFVPTFSSGSSSTKHNGDLSCFLYLADRSRNIFFPEGNSLWPWVVWLAGAISFMQQKSHGFLSLTRTIQSAALTTVGMLFMMGDVPTMKKKALHYQCSSTPEPCLKMLQRRLQSPAP